MRKSTNKYSKAFFEVFDVAKDIYLRRYPSFVYGNTLSKNELPVFCFHSTEPSTFEAMLLFLKANKYQTLTTDEYYDILRGNKKFKPDNTVLLTFDDGNGSVWSVVYPLLKKYGYRATVFLVPNLIKGSNHYYPNLDDVWYGHATIEKVLQRESSVQPFVTWEEIKVMHESGVIDFQSHTLDHSLIFTSPTIVDFVNPKIISKYHPFEFSWTVNSKEGSDLFAIPELGTPIYTSTPKMTGALKYVEDKRIKEMCLKCVEKNGGEKFFENKEWRKRLITAVEEYRKNHITQDSYEKKEEQKNAIFYDLKKSKELIEQHLRNKKVNHFCYPWGIGSALSVNISKRVGYITNFWGKAYNSLKNKIGQDPYKISRIGEDFFYLLPGDGRYTLSRVLINKLKKKILKGSSYLSH
jgi:peptidoglycan/xylan/chitin deacetylase (PgdA/CDA1 family)